MKNTSFFYVIFYILLFPTGSLHASSIPVEHYPYYYDGKIGLPEQKTPKTIGYNCREAVENYAKAFLHNNLDMPVGEPFSLISSKQLSWSPLHKKVGHQPVIREIYLTTFIRINGDSSSVISISDSTDEECAMNGKYYKISDDLTGDVPGYPMKENKDGSYTMYDTVLPVQHP
ncbi:hypothetical protein [Saccharibacter floricola]|uniref:Uncharacterized protein n=1 Tax=Saccharibacter floricola DSM 15669 TaxID=1123227 RepID=A0ABQ0P152_9PROT|nr:hypothetical protein [Saccharibacter floricola]GBQ08842.1 hypothetical protein AA15669_1930 [Saccharibacter floricola DSM 15669]